jgi:hypothetical protein
MLLHLHNSTCMYRNNIYPYCHLFNLMVKTIQQHLRLIQNHYQLIVVLLPPLSIHPPTVLPYLSLSNTKSWEFAGGFHTTINHTYNVKLKMITTSNTQSSCPNSFYIPILFYTSIAPTSLSTLCSWLQTSTTWYTEHHIQWLCQTQMKTMGSYTYYSSQLQGQHCEQLLNCSSFYQIHSIYHWYSTLRVQNITENTNYNTDENSPSTAFQTLLWIMKQQTNSSLPQTKPIQLTFSWTPLNLSISLKMKKTPSNLIHLQSSYWYTTDLTTSLCTNYKQWHKNAYSHPD